MARYTILPFAPAALAALLALASLTGCVSEADRSADLGVGTTELVSGSGRVVVEVSPEDGGAHVGKNELRVSFVNRDDATAITLEDASAFMPAHGHASRPPSIVATSDGFAVEQLIFFMSGRWEVTLNFRDRGTPDKLSFGVNVK